MDVQFHNSIEFIGRDTWNRLCGTDYPFLRYEFLAALEQSRCTCAKSGWEPRHLVVLNNKQVVAVMPLYLKHHSYGEYVFDWAWADAYHRHGLNYYPKLLNAIPFTPATGPRVGLDPAVSLQKLLPTIVEAIQQDLNEKALSSFHCLFPSAEVSELFVQEKFNQRTGCQFHWLNDSYASFDEFLDSFSSRKRKNLRKERQRVAEQGIELITKEGSEISSDEWKLFYQFYHLTYFKRSGRQGYLNQEFFLRIAEFMPESIVMVIAKEQDSQNMIAGALFFKDSSNLYGRYWGCSREYEFLHFEACYYQGIEFAIANQLQRFDPGAQGEHKIQRGFTPITTYSNHWISQPEFRDAINRFLQEERSYNERYLEEAKTLLPFKREW